jgi:membrane protein
LGLLVIPFLLWLNPSFSGDAVFWTAGAMNYVLPLGAAAAGLAGVVRILEGDDLPWWWVGLTAAGLMVTDSLQEIVSGALAASFYPHRAPIGDATGEELPPSLVPFATLLVVVLPVAFFAVWVALARDRERLGWTPMVAWAGFVGSTVFVFGSGASGDRVHFLPAALLLVTVLSLVSALTREMSGRERAGLVGITWLLLGLPSAIWADSAWVGLHANQRFVETEIIQPLKAAAPGSSVVIPNNLPAPGMSYGFSFLMPRYQEALKIYYDLPRDLNITNP